MWRGSPGFCAWIACALAVGACGKKRPEADKSHPFEATSSAASAAGAEHTLDPEAVTLLRAMASAPHELADCSNAELKRCLSPLIKSELRPSDIRDLASEQCFARGGAEVLRQAADCLPLHVGTDAKRHKELKFAFYCSDICPDQGGVSLVFEDVSESECCSIGGEPSIDPAWRSYSGCYPMESALLGGILFGMPDGPWYRVVSSHCPERAPLIVEQWPCKPPPSEARYGVTGGQLPPKAHNAPNVVRHLDTQCPKIEDAGNGLPRKLSNGWRMEKGF